MGFESHTFCCHDIVQNKYDLDPESRITVLSLIKRFKHLIKPELNPYENEEGKDNDADIIDYNGDNDDDDDGDDIAVVVVDDDEEEEEEGMMIMMMIMMVTTMMVVMTRKYIASAKMA